MTIKDLFKNPFRKNGEVARIIASVLNLNGSDDDFEGFDIFKVAKASPWVFVGLRAIVDNMAGVDYHFYKPVTKKSGARGWEVDEKHPWEKLLTRPNRFMSAYDFKRYTMLSLEMTGKAFWLPEKDIFNESTEINVLPPHLVEVLPGRNELIAGFKYRPGPGREITYSYDEVIYFRQINSVASLIDGLAGVTAAKDSIMSDLFARAWNKAYFKNASKIDGIVFTDGPYNEEGRKRELAAWDQLYKGVDKAHKIAIFSGGKGSKFQEMTHNLKDMDFAGLYRIGREEILGTLGVPPFVAGIPDAANYANADAQMRQFWELALAPRLKSFESTVTMHVGRNKKLGESWFQADLSNVKALQTNELQRAQTAQLYHFMGIPLNDIINKMDLPFDPVEEPEYPDYEDEGEEEDEGAAGAGQEQAPEDPKAQPAALVKAEESQDEVIKRMRWNSFDRGLRMHEPKFEAGMKAFFRLQRSRVLKRLRAAEEEIFPKRGRGSVKDDSPLPDNMPDLIFQLIWTDEYEAEALARATRKFIRGIYADFAIQAIKDNELPISFSLQDPAVVAFVEGKVMKLVREATGTTRESLTEEIVESVRSALAEGLTSSETIAQISDRIDGVYQFAQEYRSTLIARTETISAANTAAYDMLGRVNAKVQWLTSRDGKVRDTHQLLEGNTRPHGEPFITASGATLLYPGDPGGPPEEIIQCRCTLIKAKEQ